MKSISLVECRRCGEQYYVNDATVTLNPNDMVELAIRTIPKCSACKQYTERTKHTGRRI